MKKNKQIDQSPRRPIKKNSKKVNVDRGRKENRTLLQFLKVLKTYDCIFLKFIN